MNKFVKNKSKNKKEDDLPSINNFENLVNFDFFGKDINNKLKDFNKDNHKKVILNLEHDVKLINGFADKDNNKNYFSFYNFSMEYERSFSLQILNYLYNRNQRKINFVDTICETGIRSLRLIKNYDNYINSIDLFSLENNFKDYINLNYNLNELNTEKINLFENIFDIKNNHYDYIEIDRKKLNLEDITKAINSIKKNGIIGITISNLIYFLKNQKRENFEEIWDRENIHRSYCDKDLVLRIILSKINDLANKEGKQIKVKFYYYYKFFLKIYFTVESNKKTISNNYKTLSNCSVCPNFEFKKYQEKICKECGSENNISKNLFAENLIDKIFIDNFSNFLNSENNSKAENIKNYINELNKIDYKDKLLLNVNLKKYIKFFKLKYFKSVNIINAIYRLRYVIYKSNIEDNTFLTNCPNYILIDLMRFIVY